MPVSGRRAAAARELHEISLFLSGPVRDAPTVNELPVWRGPPSTSMGELCLGFFPRLMWSVSAHSHSDNSQGMLNGAYLCSNRSIVRLVGWFSGEGADTSPDG